MILVSLVQQTILSRNRILSHNKTQVTPHTAKTEGLLLPLCGYLSFIVGNLQAITQLYRSSTMNSLCRHVFYMTASRSCMLLIIVMFQI